jgi:hypothetical protein
VRLHQREVDHATAENLMRRSGYFLLIAATGCLIDGGHTFRLEAQEVASVTLAGVVTDQLGTPLSNVDLSLHRGRKIADMTRSTDAGRFAFFTVVPGTVTITAHRIGFRERTVQLTVALINAQQTVDIDMVAIPVDIEDVVIEGAGGRLQEFTEHRKQSKFGHFLDQNQIRQKNPRYLSELFRSIPGARLSPVAGGGNKLLLRGCKPKIWLDGMLAQYAEIDDVIAPSEIAGIEIYPSMAGVPGQYLDRENRACGSVLIWSRQS